MEDRVSLSHKLEAIYVTPTSRLSLVLGMALHSTMHQSISVGIEFLVIYAVFGLALNVQGILPALTIFALMMFALYGFGILISALALFLKEGWIIAEGLYSILMILSPVAYPLAVLPNVVRQASGVFPTGAALTGMRGFLMEGYPSPSSRNHISAPVSLGCGVDTVWHIGILFG